LNSSLTQAQPVPTKKDRDLLRPALAVAAIGTLWFILLRHLSGEWSVNEQYGYGWFVPFFAAYLFWLRWQDRPRNVLFPLRVFEIGNPDWRPLG
jgi:transmembrane exosortase EpsH